MEPVNSQNSAGNSTGAGPDSRNLEERVEDLLSRMTLEEKAGMMFQAMIMVNPDGTLFEGVGRIGPFSTREMILEKKLNHFNVLATPKPRQTAEWYNRLQELAATTRLGIPVTISSDPRHAFTDNPAASFLAGDFSQWPESLGLAATGDEELVRQFGDIARQEYVAVGIRAALHPMADLATEPRWARINGTFGEDAELSARMVGAYIRGFQGEKLGPESVACMTKHFPGGGPQKDGEDPHFPYGREQVYPGDNFDYHLIPFKTAFEAGTAQIMPYYGMPVGTELEEVGFAFNKQVITGLLREKFGFEGVVCADWGVLSSADEVNFPARAWGVENLSLHERAKKALEAGVDQFGGESCPEVIVELVRSGQVAESRIDTSVRRLLRDKFRLGLFDNTYVDPARAETIVGRADFKEAGELAQRKSIVLLKNSATPAGNILPVQGRPRLYLENIAAEVATDFGEVVTGPDQADLAILRLKTPYEQRDGNFLEKMFHAGSLEFGGAERERILGIARQVPTIVDIYLDRPAVIPEIAEASAALLANFGANDRALLDVIFGRFSPSGKLPFELPSSMEAVLRQKSDVPYDSENPLFPFGSGLTYS
ncbi:MAG: glycoside hydrolase family 3 C-terminal domain-containing protein [Chloroflexi bacterium]|nr:glycoside hydrolase family 3 C-terminal domain-containing protein [Chloroflexota bacterium]OJV99341.1 MAG: beta-glucosidase [Chloroflexi bacterium 54-19]